MRTKKRLYSNSEKEHIFRVCSDAKAKGLEMKTVYIGLADQYDTSPSAMQQMFSVMKKKRNNMEKETSLFIDQLNEPIPISVHTTPRKNLSEALEDLIKERDFYKAEYEKAMKLLGLS